LIYLFVVELAARSSARCESDRPFSHQELSVVFWHRSATRLNGTVPFGSVQVGFVFVVWSVAGGSNLRRRRFAALLRTAGRNRRSGQNKPKANKSRRR
jgi:hypothetical protein